MSSLDVATKLEAIIQTAIDGIITIDNKGIVESINEAALQLFGYQPEEVIGNNIKMLMPSPHRSEHDNYIKRYNDTHIPKIIGTGREVEGLRKNGQTFPFRLAVSEVELDNRTIFTGIIHDLSDIKAVEQQLQLVNESLEAKVEARTQEIEDVVNELLKTNRKLEASKLELKNALDKEKDLNELKSRFVSMASHEFRTPLSTIMSSASIIGKYTQTDQNDKRAKHVNRIQSAVENLTGILNDFLSLSKLEEGKVELNVIDVNIEDLCSAVSNEVQGILKKDQIVKKKIEGTPYFVKTDPRILKNIMFNLMSNAIKYSGEQSIIECIKIYTPENFSITIKDNGIGIPAAEQAYLFERFYRASNVENIQGTGLGLNIVKRYVHLLKGEISFESQEGIGTTFTVKIPQL